LPTTMAGVLYGGFTFGNQNCVSSVSPEAFENVIVYFHVGQFNRPLPRSSTPNCHWPVLAHGHQLGHCWGARPSRWPFSPSRRGRDGALRRPPARAFPSPAGRQKFRWPKTGKRQRGHRSAMSLPIPTGLNHSAQGCAGALPWVGVPQIFLPGTGCITSRQTG
jgi:hypothetical protein